MSGHRRTTPRTTGKPTRGTRKITAAREQVQRRLDQSRDPAERVHIAVGYAAGGLKTSQQRAAWYDKRARRFGWAPMVHNEQPFAELSQRLSRTAEELYSAAERHAGPDRKTIRARRDRYRRRLDEAIRTGPITTKVLHVSAYLWSAHAAAARYGITVDLEPYVRELCELGEQYRRRNYERS